MGATKFVISQFIKKGEEFVYVRRYKSDISKSVSTFFKSIISNKEFPNNNLYIKGNHFFCDDKICGYAVTLSTAQDLKSSNFDKVKTIIFDEFIIDEGQKKYYLQNEVEVFLNLLETIGRMRDIRVLMLGNAGNIVTNPYMLYFNLNVPSNTDIKLFKDGLILVQYMKNDKYRKEKANTKLGRLVSGTDFEKYAILNQDLHINNDFIEKKSGSSKFSFSFVYNNETFGVWVDYLNNKVFVSNDYIKNSPYNFAITLKDHSPNTMFLHSGKNFTIWKNFINNYKFGNVRFENNKIKLIVSQVIRMMMC